MSNSETPISIGLQKNLLKSLIEKAQGRQLMFAYKEQDLVRACRKAEVDLADCRHDLYKTKTEIDDLGAILRSLRDEQ